MSKYEIPQISKDINFDNYFINCYTHLTKAKQLHFLFTLIEIGFNIVSELEIYLRGFQMKKLHTGLNLVLYINKSFNEITPIIKFMIVIFYLIIFMALHIFVILKKFKIYHIRITLLVDILELFCFRTIMLIFLNCFFTLDPIYFIIGCLFLIPYIYLIIKNFLYNHLYYFTPIFIQYPYDEFSSLFDIILFLSKLLLSASGTSNNIGLGQFCFFILFFAQIFFSFYFIYLLNNHSYLFMKNSFLNRTRIGLFFTQSVVIFFGILFGKSEIMTALFLIISIITLLICMNYMYFIYNPYSHMRVKRETPMENIYFYFFILSEKNDFDFVFENKINEHYEKCGICDLCMKYKKYLNRYKNKPNISDDEKEQLISQGKNEIDKNKILDLFDIIYDQKTKYFELMKKLVTTYKRKGKDALSNNHYYYINLLFLIYSDYKKKNITLSLNERILLEVINKENRAFLDNHESQINQLLFCNSFIFLSSTILNKLKDIINSESNSNKAMKIIDLSKLLKEMKNKKYKNNLFSHKLENVSNSRHLILVCSFIYEEIFNTTLNNSQLPIRENIQPFEDIFHNNSNKINKIITLSVDLTRTNCRILRAGKGLSSYVDSDLFDLFPLVFKEYQIKLFMSSILEKFELNENKEDFYNNYFKNENYKKRISSKNAKGGLKFNYNNRSKKEFIEIKLILCENISGKMYYKLLTLKLTPLFNNYTHHFILFDGVFMINKYSLITLQDFEENINAKEKLIGLSGPEFEKFHEIYSVPFKKYISWLNNEGFIETKESTFKISVKIYNIYILTQKNYNKKKIERKSRKLKGTRMEDDDDDEEEEESQNSIKKNSRLEKIQIIEDNASASSQQTGSTYSTGISNLGMRNKKRDNIQEFGIINNIKKLNLILIFIAIVLLVFEFFYLKYLQNNLKNNNNALLDFREFSKLYFQLFSSILGVACIESTNGCLRIVDIFTQQFFTQVNPDNEFFNFTLYVMIQNKILAKSMMNKRSYLTNIHKFIGNKKYNELFGKEIDYLRITQNIVDGKYVYDLSKLKVQFSEAILFICNSFQILAAESTSVVNFLNKTITPFSFLNEHNKNNIVLDEYQKDFYEMLLNYNFYYTQFFSTNNKLENIIFSKDSFFKLFAYIYITLDTLVLISIGTLMLSYGMSFEFILIKVINYINMSMNVKNDDFNFSASFLKKIEILEDILDFYKSDPAKSVQNLNNLYNSYQQYLTTKNKNNAMDMNKKNYKKMMDDNKKNELDDVPKNQRIMTIKDARATGLTFIFTFIYYSVLIIILITYAILVILWTNYFSKRDHFFSLMKKNISLENGIYVAINAYDLMIFQSLNINEVTEIILPDNHKEENALIKSFYEELKLAFNSKKEKNNIGNIYKDFEDTTDFKCSNIFENISTISEVINDTSASTLKNITQNLIELCELTKITETKDIRTIFERHFQYIRNGILSLNDFTNDGIINHIINDKFPSRVSLFFDTVVINVLILLNSHPHREGFKRLIKVLKSIILSSEIIFLSFDIIAILFVVFFYLPGINSLFSQIFILKKIFKIFEIQE